jgi:hypothetical protein
LFFVFRTKIVHDWKSISSHSTRRASDMRQAVANMNVASAAVIGLAWAQNVSSQSIKTGFLIFCSNLNFRTRIGGHKSDSAQWLMTARVGVITCRLRVAGTITMRLDAPLRAVSLALSFVFGGPLRGGEFFSIEHPVQG